MGIKRKLLNTYKKFTKNDAAPKYRVTKSGIKYQMATNPETKEKYVKVIGLVKGTETVKIPMKIRDIPVEVIGKEAFKGNTSLKEVIIGRNVRLIGAEAFKDCLALEMVELPADLETINKGCFENCTSLKTAVLPYGVKKISERAFKNCSKVDSMFHRVKTGLGAKPILSKTLTEEKLPSGLRVIEEEAFAGCESITSVYIPFKVETIAKNAFKGCKSVKEVAFHANFKELEEGVFAGCDALESVKLPLAIEKIHETAFDKTCNVKFYEGTSETVQAVLVKGTSTEIKFDPISVDSKMVPGEKDSCFYTEEELELALETYELRTPISEVIERESVTDDVVDSRYVLEDGIYKYKDESKNNTAKIVMAGDLMCRPKQIESALHDGVYNFDEEFDLVRDILKDSDLTIGNMETMVAKSVVYSDVARYIDDRVHLNAPDAWLNSVRKAGFDVVINSQNHAYDAGLRGVYETLDAQNKQQLMHTGIFASGNDKRYISLEVNGIKVAIVSYFDQARQAMKRVNYTEKGLNVIYSNFYEEQIKEDIKNAREEGAEFVIAYCHWGKEYTDEITKIQEGFAYMVANAGADYLFGSHAHCLQPYDVLVTNDGREVPVLYSGGNFLSDMSIKMPIVRDTLIAELELYRDENGKVQIKSEGYHPCLIKSGAEEIRGDMYTVPISTLLKGECTEEERIQLERDVLRINGVVGRIGRFNLLLEDEINPLKKTVEDGSKYAKYTLKKPLMIEINNQEDVIESRYVKPEGQDIYEGRNNLETQEAILMCTGQIHYDAEMGNRAKFGNHYNFRENFQLVKKTFDKADFVIGNFTTNACETYLSSEMMKSKYNPNQFYSNARVEYLDAIKYAGFDCLATANQNNLDTGVQGVVETAENIEKYGMIAAGIGEDKNKVFNINDIRVGVLSYTMKCKDAMTTITAEGADALLNIYSRARAARDIKKLREQGAEFILTYIACGNDEEKANLAQRRRTAEEVAEMGADYVICTVPKIVSRYYKHETKDGRMVPVATSIGTFMSGDVKGNTLSAAIRIKLYKSADGSIDLSDDFIPLKQFKSHDGYNLAVAPAIKAFYKGYKVADFPKVKTTLQEKLGAAIKVADDKIVKINEYTRAHFTFDEIFKITGLKPSADVLKAVDTGKKATSIAVRRAELKEGCVAILINHVGYKKPEFQIELEDAIKAKASLVITTKKTDKLPCIVVKNNTEMREIVTKLYEAVIAKYSPITVAITGTAGKTTTKEFTSCVFDTHYKTLHVEGNYNQFWTCGTVLQKLDNTYEAYVQEVHGGTKNSAKRISNLIKPDIAIVTNIGDGHLLDMGTIENVIEGKLDIAAGLKDTGVFIVNNDNEYMKDLQIEGKRIIHYSTYDTNCEYYAQNIQNFGDKVKFQVVCEKGVFDLVLNMQGMHNIGNAVAVFAAGTEAGIPPHKIRAGLTHYVPDADKQNLMEFNGYNMIVDTYSATPISVESAMQTLNDYPVAEGARRIAVLGDIPALGDASEEKHIELGERICRYNFDLMLCVGTDSRHFATAARKIGKEAYSYEDREAFNRKLAESIHPGDFILFKSGTRSHLKEETIYPLFGLIDKQ